jgi:hypothetical protein
MAILHLLPGVQASIEIDGQPAQEYDDEDEKILPKATTKYIEAKSGAEFAVCYQLENDFERSHDISVRVSLDGKYADSACHELKHIGRDFKRRISSARERVGDQYFESKFRFASLSTGMSSL